MSNKIVTLPLDEFNELIRKLEEYKLANKKLNDEIKEYNKKFANKEGYKNGIRR